MGLTKQDLDEIKALNPSNETYKYHMAILQLYCGQYEMLEKIEKSLRQINEKLSRPEPVITTLEETVGTPVPGEKVSGFLPEEDKKSQPPSISKVEERIESIEEESKPFQKIETKTEKDIKKTLKVKEKPLDGRTKRGRENLRKRK